MPTRLLSESEKKKVGKLIDLVRSKLTALSNSDPHLLFAYRRKLYKELTYDERGRPMYRRKLKTQKWEEQGRKCAACHRKMPLKDFELDRIEAMAGYTLQNVRVVHHRCHRKEQEDRRFA